MSTKQAAAWLKRYLLDCGGEATAVDVIRAGKAAGHAERTLHRARALAGAVTERHGFGTGAVQIWRLTPDTRDGTGAPPPAGDSGTPGSGSHGSYGAGSDEPVDIAGTLRKLAAKVMRTLDTLGSEPTRAETERIGELRRLLAETGRQESVEARVETRLAEARAKDAVERQEWTADRMEATARWCGANVRDQRVRDALQFIFDHGYEPPDSPWLEAG